MSTRGPRTDLIVIRLAQEGVPVGAIARALLMYEDEVVAIVDAAVESGAVFASPASDWPEGSRVRDRRPTSPPLDLGEMNAADVLQLHHHVRPGVAKFIGLLLQRGFATTADLVVVIGAKGRAPKNIKTYACQARRLLREAYGVDVRSVWGAGYAIADQDREKVVAGIVRVQRGEMADAA